MCVCVCVCVCVEGSQGRPPGWEGARQVAVDRGSPRASIPVLQGHVYRFCTADGLWLQKDNSSLPWRDLSECEDSKRGDRVS